MSTKQYPKCVNVNCSPCRVELLFDIVLCSLIMLLNAVLSSGCAQSRLVIHCPHH